MVKRGKKYIDNRTGLEGGKTYKLEDGIEVALKHRYAKFDESVDVAIRLGVDPKHADQMVRSSIVLPNGIGKMVRILVFAKGEKQKEALEAGADFAGAEEYVEKIQSGWLEFDRTIATPDMMGAVGKVGRILGPRGLMPNAKVGTVTFDVGRAVKEVKSGKVDFKVDRAGVVHAMIGKTSFGTSKLRENILSFVDKIIQLKPSSSKGVYLKGMSLSTTMGPGIKIDLMEIHTLLKQA